MHRHLLLWLACAAAVLAAEPGPDWSRALSATAFASRAGWVSEPGGADRVSIALRNAAAEAWTGVLRVDLCDGAGKLVRRRDAALSVPAGGEATAETEVSFAGRGSGEHLLRWRLLRGPADDRRQDAGWERSCMVAAPEQIFILLEREPIARGIELVRQHVQPVEIVSGGLRRWVWKSTHGSSALGWWRSHRFRITDPAFRDGAAPVVDVLAASLQRSDAPLSITADLADGSAEAARGWGGRGPAYAQDPPWRRTLARIDAARFAGGWAGADPASNPADACDLRYNACSVDGELRSLVATRYDLERDPQWARLLRPLGVECGRDRYVFAPGERVEAVVRLANRARVPFAAVAEVAFATDRDRVLWSRAMPVEVAPGGEGALRVPIDTAGLPYGVYVLRTGIGELRSETLIAVSDLEPLPPAADGEFLYGSDLGAHWSDATALDWAGFMGIDMVRNCARRPGPLDQADLDGAIAELRRRGLRGTLMVDPAWDPDAGKRAAGNAGIAAALGAAARRHAGFLRWYELGNEPDLPFFYAGPTAAYVEGYLALHAAVKANDPDSVVMNGGLCFHSEIGWKRAHEIVAAIPADRIDAWAYHGHGPGIAAERSAWLRQDAAVSAVGKGGRDYIETESGLFASDPPGWRRQAQTIIEKAVFAQSVRAPTFLWFNLNMGGGDWGYTTVERRREPRPAVLAHRAMVAALRGLRHERAIDLLSPEAEAHLFAAADGRRALVLWSDRGEITRGFAVGPGCSGLRRIDMAGNASALAEAAPGLVQASFGADPVFIAWTAGDPAFAVSMPPPPIAAPARLRVVPGRPAMLPLVLRNPGAEELSAELVAAPAGGAPVRVEPGSRPLRLGGGAQLPLPLPVQVAAVAPSLWPRQWTVFAPVPGEIDAGAFDAIPRSLAARGAAIAPLPGLPDGLDLDLGRLAGGHQERKQALCFAWIDSDQARTIEVGASGDWWMEWWVNGRRVYSTMDAGNKAPMHILAHVFPVPLQAGRNLVAVKVLSGSAGWRLVAGGPDEVAAARRERAGESDGLVLELTAGGRLLARQPVPVEVLRPVDALPAGAAWTDLAPDGVLGTVANLHAAQPDNRFWYKGAEDLSGRVWLRDDGADLVVAVEVADDAHQPGDRCILRLAAGADLSRRSEMALAGARDDAARRTRYEARIPRPRLGADRFALQVQVHDDDWGAPKQHAAWGEGDDPEGWFQAWIRAR